MLINFCRVISIMLQETSLDGQPDGADMFFPSCIYSFLQITDKQILQDISTNIQFVKHFRHQDRLSGEDEYYLTTLESVIEFIHGVSHKDLKIDEQAYQEMVKAALKDIDKDHQIKEEAAQQELADLLEINNHMNESTSEASHAQPKKEKKSDGKLEKLDKVYSEMKGKNKKLKKELGEQKTENETLRTIFAEFQVEFKQNRKHEKQFEELTISDLQDIFAIQQKLMVQIESMNINGGDLKNDNWAEFDMMEQTEQQPARIPTTKKQEETIRRRAERGSSRSTSRSRRKKSDKMADGSTNLLNL